MFAMCDFGRVVEHRSCPFRRDACHRCGVSCMPGPYRPLAENRQERQWLHRRIIWRDKLEKSENRKLWMVRFEDHGIQKCWQPLQPPFLLALVSHLISLLKGQWFQGRPNYKLHFACMKEDEEPHLRGGSWWIQYTHRQQHVQAVYVWILL